MTHRRLFVVVLMFTIGLLIFNIILRLNPSQGERVIRGQVLHHGQPIPNALVRWKGTKIHTETDQEGRFEISSKPADSVYRLTAHKSGYFIAGAMPKESLTIDLHAIPQQDNPDYQWVSPDLNPKIDHACANCHLAIYDEWQSSGHSRSATNTRFLNLYEGTDWSGKKEVSWGLLKEHPLGAGVCASCHAPSVSDSEAAFLDITKIRGVASKGVHCDFCHKIAGPDEEAKVGLAHGRYGYQFLRPKTEQLFFGPLDDVDRGEDIYSPFYKESRYCASCHEGIVFGVHVYSTYSEWLESPAQSQGVHCQDCHMTPTGQMTNIAKDRGGMERNPHTLGNHRFWNGSQRSMLKSCLKVDVQTKRMEDQVKVMVAMKTNGVGHRVPTGFIDRHLILVIEGQDTKGKVIDALTADSRLPSIVGVDLENRPGRLYAKRLIDADGQSPAPFWRPGVSILEDTRLKPGQSDTVHATFPQEVKQVRVRVIHRRFWQHITKAKHWPTTDLIVVDRTVK